MSLDAKTANARSKTLNNSSGRWSVDEGLGGKGLEALYANAKGSIYTAMGGGNLPAGAKSPGLNDQIGTMIKRFIIVYTIFEQWHEILVNELYFVFR